MICELNNTEAKPVRDEVLEKIRESGTPCIMINAKEDGFYSVGVDNYAIMYDNIRFLYEEKECRSFWFVMGPEENYENSQRTKALLDFAKKKKLKKNERRQEHFQVFLLSAMFSAAAFLSSVLSVRTGECSWGFFIGSAMAMVSFFIAVERETNYV